MASERKITETALYIAELLADTFIASKVPSVLQPTTERIKDRLLGQFQGIIERRKAEAWVENLVTQTTEKLQPIIDHYPLPDNDLESVKTSFEETLHAAADIFTADVWLDLKLNKTQIEQHIRSKQAKNISVGWTDNAIKLYDHLIRDSAHLAVSLIPLLPNFAAEAIPNILEELDKTKSYIDDKLDEFAKVFELSLANSDENVQRYEESYRHALAETLDYPDAFGLDVAHNIKRYRLSTAYISLQVSFDINQQDADILLRVRELHELGKFGDAEETMREHLQASRVMRIHEVLPKTKLLLIRGEAGSGKTTLLRWLAVQAALGQLQEPLNNWNSYIPLFIRLRDFSDQDLPTENDFTYLAEERIDIERLSKWVQQKLKAGEAMLLIDGVDEIPKEKRELVRTWVAELYSHYPNAPIIISSRPEAIQDKWLETERFTDAMLLPMQQPDIEQFVKHWHQAIFEQGIYAEQEIRECETKLLDQIEKRLALRQLAQNPLLCASLCALNRDTGRMPEDRMRLYERFVEMLLDKRDWERELRLQGVLDYKQKRALLSKLAYWMLVNNDKDNPVFVANLNDAKPVMENVWHTMARGENADFEVYFQELLERSGLLRNIGSERIEFSHRTLGEYLAAQQFVSEHDVGVLARRSDNDLWHESIVFAIGYANENSPPFRDSLLQKLIEQAEQQNERNQYLLLLACLEHKSLQLKPEFQQSFKNAIPKILPLENSNEVICVSQAGNWAVDHLRFDSEWEPEQSGRAVEALGRIATSEALEALESFGDYRAVNRWWYEPPEPVANNLLQIMPRFETDSQNLIELFNKVIISLETLRIDNLPQLSDVGSLKLPESLNELRLVNLPQLSDVGSLKLPESLNELALVDLPQLSDVGSLKLPESLNSLRLENLPQLSDVGSLKLPDSLKSLRLENLPQLSDVGSLKLPESLNSLTLYNLPQLSDVGSLKLPDSLNELRLYNLPQLSDVGSLKLPESLKSLELDNLPQRSDVGSLKLPDSLKSLRLENLPQLSDVGSLKLPDSLKSLRLENLPQLSDVGSLKLPESLNELRLYNLPQLSDVGSLKLPESLNSLGLYNLPQLSNDSIEKFKQAHPKIKVSVY